MKTLYVTLLFLLFISNGKAQPWKNLVPNYSFSYSDLSMGKSTSFFKESLLQTAINERDDSNDSLLPRRNSVYIELLGGGIFYSIGYENKLVIRRHYELIASIGISSNFNFHKPEFEFGLPISINNRFKFWKFNGVDIGLTLAEFFNIWAIQNPEKYNNPLGQSHYPIIWRPSFHIGWMFKFNHLIVSPRFYGFYGWSATYGFGINPFLGLRASYCF